MAQTQRLFIALYPGESVARDLLAQVRAMRLARHRLVPMRQVHLTVRFLGETKAEVVESIALDLDRIARRTPPLRLRIERLITLPRTRARLVAAETDLPPALERLFEAAALLPGAPVRPGPPTPHLTLARFARGVRARPINQPIDPIPMPVDEVRVVRSELGPEGATHEPVRIVRFAGGWRS